MSALAILTKCPLANCPLANCPLANCPLANCPLAKCHGFGNDTPQKKRKRGRGLDCLTRQQQPRSYQGGDDDDDDDHDHDVDDIIRIKPTTVTQCPTLLQKETKVIYVPHVIENSEPNHSL